MIKLFALVLLASVTACAAQPAPQAAPATTTTTTTTTPTVWPRFDTARSVDGVDTCALLEAKDFDGVGSFSAPPRPYDAIPGSCVYQVGDGDEDDLVVTVVFAAKYEEVKEENPRGFELLVDGHTRWMSCGNGGTAEMSCLATVAVNAERTLQVGMSLHDATADQMSSIMRIRVSSALKRLPLA